LYIGCSIAASCSASAITASTASPSICIRQEPTAVEHQAGCFNAPRQLV
jgi:hypothetical protein